MRQSSVATVRGVRWAPTLIAHGGRRTLGDRQCTRRGGSRPRLLGKARSRPRCSETRCLKSGSAVPVPVTPPVAVTPPSVGSCGGPGADPLWIKHTRWLGSKASNASNRVLKVLKGSAVASPREVCDAYLVRRTLGNRGCRCPGFADLLLQRRRRVGTGVTPRWPPCGPDPCRSDRPAREHGDRPDHKVQRLPSNAGVAFMGDTKGGRFDIMGDVAWRLLQLPANPNGRPNADVSDPG